MRYRILKTVTTPVGKVVKYFIKDDNGAVRLYDSVEEAKNTIDFERACSIGNSPTEYKLHKVTK